jgi:hypothetical protein
MKRLLSVLVVLGILSTCMFVYSAEKTSWTASKALFKVMVRGQEYTSETPPIGIEGRTYLPLRAMGNVLGVSVEWNAQLKQAEVDMAETTIDDKAKVETPLSDAEKKIWKKTSWNATKAPYKVMVRGEEFVSENPPIVIEGRTFLPLRALGDALGVKVDWNDKLKQAEVDMAATVTPEATKPATPAATTTPAAVTPTPAAATPTPAAATPTPTTSSSSSSSSSSNSQAPAPTPVQTEDEDSLSSVDLEEFEEIEEDPFDQGNQDDTDSLEGVEGLEEIEE